MPDDNYDDIIQLPHHVSRLHPHMSLHDRAAQFAPFAIMSGQADIYTDQASDNELEYDELT